MESNYSRPRALVQSMVLASTPLARPGLFLRGRMVATRFDIDALLAKFTPEYCIKMFQDLELEGRLSHAEVNASMEYVFPSIDKHGAWKREEESYAKV